MIPSWTSTTPGILPRASASFGPSLRSVAPSSEKHFTSMGWGTAVRSPMRSSMSWASSMSRPGTSFSTRTRTASITFSMGGRGKPLSRMKKSPSLASVTPPPSWRPVRRE